MSWIRFRPSDCLNYVGCKQILSEILYNIVVYKQKKEFIFEGDDIEGQFKVMGISREFISEWMEKYAVDVQVIFRRDTSSITEESLSVVDRSSTLHVHVIDAAAPPQALVGSEDYTTDETTY